MLFQLLVSIPWKISGFGIRIVALLLFSLLLFALSLFAITLFSLRSLLFRSFALSLFTLLLFALSLCTLLLKITHITLQSHCEQFALVTLQKKKNSEWIALVALYKRTTMSDLLLSLLTYEQPWANCSHRSLKKSKISNSLVFSANGSQKWTNPSCPSLLSRFFKEQRSDLLSLLFTKKWQWVNCSRSSLQKSKCEQFAQVVHHKRATGTICSFSWVDRSFPHKKRVICLNSQPLKFMTFILKSG